ncbi:DUF2867 domain-containing protein [Motilimonas pumila]|uniref:DUF2867 domain-containing protein n=1 Tax=Motilimonas pumila TaxID=2303987 RepID=UPI0018E0B676
MKLEPASEHVNTKATLDSIWATHSSALNQNTGNGAGCLTIESAKVDNVACAIYERNVDMQLSVLKLSEQVFAISTLINLITRAGKAYITLIKPFHKQVSKYCICCTPKAGRV